MPPPSRIALFTYATKPRGSVIHTLELAAALQGLGHAVTVYALDKDGSGFDRSLPCPVKLVPARPAPDDIDHLIRQRIQEFVDFLTTDLSLSGSPESYDIYHAQDCISANALSELRQRGQISRFIRTVHHIEAFNSPYLQACQDRSIREPDLCLCVSQLWQEALQVQYGRTALRVVNGVDRQRFTPTRDGSETALKYQLGMTGHPIYLTVGGIEPRKNTLALLQAFAQVLHHFPQAQLIIAGGATLFDYQAYRDRCWQLIQTTGLTIGQSLLLPGVMADADMPALYRCADAFVFPSVKEGWGLVVLEAIAAGLPVITANQAPFTEFLTDQTALLIDPQNVNAIATAMQMIIQPEIAQSLKQTSSSVLEHYSWEHSAQLHIQHYQTCLQTPSIFERPEVCSESGLG